MLDPKVEQDIIELSKTKLREKYILTYTSWSNMKSRRHRGSVVHTDFLDFTNFLKIIGPRTSKDHSLDRLDPSDPEYAPGKVKWSNKMQQANNQSRTIKLEYKGKTKPLTEWCRELGLKADTVRRRYHKGGTSEEILFGKQKAAHIQVPKRTYHTTEQKWPWLSARRALEWEERFKEEHNHLESRYEFFLENAESELARNEMKLPPLQQLIEECRSSHRNHPATRQRLLDIDMTYDEIVVEFNETKNRLEVVKRKYEEALEYKDIQGIFHDPMPLR